MFLHSSAIMLTDFRDAYCNKKYIITWASKQSGNVGSISDNSATNIL